MAYEWHTTGHKKQLEFLGKSLDSGKIAHAYVFAGAGGIGKKTIARNLARILLCQAKVGCGTCPNCQSFARGINPDYIELAIGETVKIEQVRKLIYQINLKPYQSTHRVAVIDEADDMTTEAANALLKSMEEPKPNTLLVLITSNPYRLLPTILSRVQKINFGLVDYADYLALLPEKLSKEQKHAVESLAFGRPGTAISISSDDDSLERLMQMDESFTELIRGNLGQRLVLASRLAEDEDIDLPATLSFWLSALEKKLTETGDAKTAGLAARVARAKNLLDGNANAKLVLADMMVNEK